MLNRRNFLLASLMALGIPAVLANKFVQAEEDDSDSFDFTTQFAMNWFHNAVDENPEDNLAISPLGMYRLVGSLFLGSENQTLVQLKKALNWNGDREPWLFAIRDLTKRLIDHGGLKVADGMWIKEKYQVDSGFVGLMNELGNAKIERINFDDAKTCKSINSWIRKQTGGDIPEMFKSISPETRLLLADAISFRGMWAEAFDEADTYKGYFSNMEGKKVRFPMMNRTGKYRYMDDDDLQWLEIPYKGQQFAMGILLPRKASQFIDVEKEFSSEMFGFMRNKAEEQDVEICLPRFTFNNSVKPIAALRKMGVEDAFADTADFSSMTPANDIMVSEITQNVFLEVNEKGTEAKAASTATFIPKSASNNTKFFVNHPFIFTIFEQASGTILFMGRFTNPEKMTAEMEKIQKEPEKEEEKKPEKDKKEKVSIE